MTGRATFGDFLHAAHWALAGGADMPTLTHGDVGEVSRSLLRLVTIFGRYLQDMATTPSQVPGSTPVTAGPWDRARGQAREALTNSAGYLIGLGTSGRRWPAAPSASPLAQCLDQVATSLTVGRDLLRTHFAPGPKGWVHQSPWAPAIASERVNRALLAELGALAAPIAHHGANVALAPIPGAPESTDRRRRLNAACQWLWVLTASVEAARRAAPVPACDRDLLAAIPVNTLPQRPLLEGAETVPGLCAGVIATAERLRHLAWHAAQQPPGSPGLTVTSARQAAETSTVTSHNCALIASALSAASHSTSPAISADLTAAADAARQAGGSWYQIARALRQVTTDTRGHLSPAAAEAHDLAWWTGRLAYTDPTWTPASGPHHPARPPHELAARPGDVPQVVAAVHHAGEALAQLAETEHNQLRAATHAGRILVPTRTLTDDYNIPRPYATALPEHTGPLLARYRDARHATRQVTISIGCAADATGAPSRALTTARAATTATPSAGPAANPDDQAAPDGKEQTPDMPGPLQQALLGLGITSPSLLTRGAGLDQASQRLLIEAADELPPAQQRPPAMLNATAGSATLVNHALASSNPQAARLLRQPGQAEREEPEPEP